MRFTSLFLILAALFAFGASTELVQANSFYDGGGLQDGLNKAQQIDTGGTGDARETLRNILFGIISFMGVIAVLVIVIAGIILIIGGGDEQQRQKATKMVIYAIIGLLIIILAGAIVRTTLNIF